MEEEDDRKFITGVGGFGLVEAEMEVMVFVVAIIFPDDGTVVVDREG